MILKMVLQIRFNREIDKDKDYISPGGYEMVMNGKNVQFDFCDHYGTICLTDRSICTFQLEHPDYDSFPKIEKVTLDDLKNISKITECFVYTDEEGESNLEPIEIVSISFVIPDSKTPVIEISDKVINEYNESLSKERRRRNE